MVGPFLTRGLPLAGSADGLGGKLTMQTVSDA